MFRLFEFLLELVTLFLLQSQLVLDLGQLGLQFLLFLFELSIFSWSIFKLFTELGRRLECLVVLSLPLSQLSFFFLQCILQLCYDGFVLLIFPLSC